MNSYYMFLDVRDNMNEASAAHWADKEIKRKLNASQRKAAMIMYQSPGEWFMTSIDITPAASLVTLPDDCVRPAYLEHKAQGFNIPIRDSVRERRLTRQPSTALGTGGEYSAYLKGGYLEINKSGFSDPVTLWYMQRPVDLVYGTGDTGSTTTTLVIPITAEPSMVDDYYNGRTIEYTAGTGVSERDTIADYDASTRALTTVTTVGATTVFGTVSQIPVEGHEFIVLDATITLLAKPSSAIDPKYFTFFKERRDQAWKEFSDHISSRISGSMRTRIAEIE